MEPKKYTGNHEFFTFKGVTAIEVAMKANCFTNLSDADTKIRSGGFRINHTLITNPQEALIYGQHILNNNTSVILVGK